MPERFEFKAPIEAADRGGAVVRIPFDVEKTFGKKRVAVQAMIGGLPYRGSVVRMGDDYVLGILKEIRQQLGKETGDVVQITLEEDVAPRTVDVPEDLVAALAGAADAKAHFDKLSFSHKREYIRWIDEAKRDETRQRRIAQAVEMLSAGKSLR